jgi:exo-beta-1,3-glucanase (GH17 family)
MNERSVSARRVIGVLLAVMWAVGGCSSPPPDASDPTPAPSGTPTPSPVPTATLTPTPLPTPTPGPEVAALQPLGIILSSQADTGCAASLPEGGYLLGADPDTCAPVGGGSLDATVAVPPASTPHVITLRVTCPGGCAQAVEGTGGFAALYVDEQLLWSAGCDVDGVCDPLALGDGPTVTFISPTGVDHTVRLETTGNVSWPVSEIAVGWLPVPSIVQGIAYSPYRDCQNPHWGPWPDEAAVRQDLQVIRHAGNAIRTYSSRHIEGEVPALAREAGLRVSAGAWLDADYETNEEEIEALIALAQTVDLESVIVGNEVLLRGDLTEDELIAYIERVKAAVDVPVTTAEIGFVLLDHPRVIEALDYLMVHIYAYWDGQPIEDAARYTVDVFHQVEVGAGGKPVVIGEVGWPADGPTNGRAVPSLANQRRFMREFLSLAQQEGIPFYYFAAFDELWKTEGGVGPYWGFNYPGRSNKFDVTGVLAPLSDAPPPLAANVEPAVTGTPSAAGTEAEPYFGVYTDYAVYSARQLPPENHFAPSGWMGDAVAGAISFDDCVSVNGEWADRAIQITYNTQPTDEYGWVGIYWQYPDSNWADMPEGYDLSQYSGVRFRARSDLDGAEVKFLVGGVIDGPYPSSVTRPVFAEGADWAGFIPLSTQWETYTIELSAADLSHVIDGFGWVAERRRTPDGVTIYLDDIVYY